jgi:hypothetical protein
MYFYVSIVGVPQQWPLKYHRNLGVNLNSCSMQETLIS